MLEANAASGAVMTGATSGPQGRTPDATKQARLPRPSIVRMDETTRAERQSALRALLRTPMMTAETAPDHFGLVRRHAAWLREWVFTHAGWRLDVTAEYARLRKLPADLSEPV